MLKFLKRYFHLFIIPICLIIRVIRKSQLDSLDRLKFGYEHSSGSHTLLEFISIGVYFTVVYMVFQQLYKSSYTKEVRAKLYMFIGLVSVCALFIITSVIR